MKKITKKLLLGASIAAGVSAIATTPAFAGSLTNPTVSGGQSIRYDADATNTFENRDASLSKILTGDSSSPTGNVELFSDSETNTYRRLNDFRNAPVTTLSGTIGDKSIALSSLTGADWFTTKSGEYSTAFRADNLANRWFQDFITKAGSTYNANTYGLFSSQSGFQRSSDPNISYVNQDDSTGQIKIGLAGHYNLRDVYGSFVPNGFQASEVVKYTYNGVTDYLYSFEATRSGLIERGDGKSHSGNYEVTIQGVAPASVPEPSVMLGLLGICGILATQRQLKKA